ncbi:SDR family oxidoreductase [bacterium]|nr:SDR family oxidoreductase [bacterium]
MALVLITGGTSGLGLGLAECFANQNYQVVVTGRNEQKFYENCKNRKIAFFQCDVTNENQVKNLHNFIASNSQSLEILINNAGIGIAKNFCETQLSEWNEIINTNLTGTFLVTKELLPLLEKSAKAHIFNIVSVAGKRTFAGWSTYCASKFGVHAFTLVAREELRAKKIRVTGVYPGAINTPFWENIEGDFAREKMMTSEDIFPQILAAYEAHERVLIEEIVIGLAQGDF